MVTMGKLMSWGVLYIILFNSRNKQEQKDLLCSLDRQEN